MHDKFNWILLYDRMLLMQLIKLRSRIFFYSFQYTVYRQNIYIFHCWLGMCHIHGIKCWMSAHKKKKWKKKIQIVTLISSNRTPQDKCVGKKPKTNRKKDQQYWMPMPLCHCSAHTWSWYVHYGYSSITCYVYELFMMYHNYFLYCVWRISCFLE